MRFKEKRSMKVYAGNDQNYKPIAQIRLQGKCLEEIGFVPGIPIEVKCENVVLEIRVLKWVVNITK